ncbi:hypothetical protein GCM10007388_43900 [Pseudoduganella plicata]|uniref:DUF2345 domain-containing protein n=1 Tax=Pseudoduganella plicata TaxID=321984 RepID=A0AA87Y8A9_9BURK|nr:hypothetical protein GCM10007388_43900 [Pseudoduganella plicata]
MQLRSTYAGSELTLGHLIHAADNYRGSLRGQGAELRTDAYGAARCGAGLLVSSYVVAHSAGSRDPVGDNAAGIALMKQAVKLGETFSEAAVTHNTVALASSIGPAKAGASSMSDKEAPLAAMLTAVSGMVEGDSLGNAKGSASAKKTSPGDGSLPHSSDPIIAISAKAGLGVTAAGAVQMSNGETVTLMSGADTQSVSGGQMRVHSGQAIGVLGGAVAPGTDGIGVQVISAKDAIDVQAQADTLTVQARDDVNVISANSFIDFAAAKSISLSTAGGANITVNGGNITVQCPGTILIKAGKKSFVGPHSIDYPLPAMPNDVCKPCLLAALRSGSAFVAPAGA